MGREFSAKRFDLIKNRNGYIYYKLYIDDICQFEEFCEELKSVPRNEKSLAGILSLMEMYRPQFLPEAKFRQIKGIGRADVFEFKKGIIRVYVVRNASNIYVVMGGYKRNQKEDINRLKSRLKGFE